eukprot:GHRQ01014879.1.p1 GENE.GHRQ01014879.1~~GHRQ01014879.1.p1  ORF type:complete len:407 (+),score=117.05 GHRQ01014879.1:237-1457(+)
MAHFLTWRNSVLHRCTRACAGLPALRQRSIRPGVVRTWGRRPAVSTRAVLPGSEQLTDFAIKAASVAGVSQALYLLSDDSVKDAASSSSGGAFGFLADGFEAFLKVLEGGLSSAGVPYSYGFAIILLTLLVKAATYPLSKKSMESTLAMQAVAPRVKELQARYANDPETLQLETARMYKTAGINPLAGCLPTLATIPVFIGLYRALTKAADDGLLTSGFFWIPSLGGPSSMAAQKAGSGLTWLFPFVDGHPPIGWHDAVAYLVLPVLLVASQFISQKIVSPKSTDPTQQQTQAILGFIPFMIGEAAGSTTQAPPFVLGVNMHSGLRLLSEGLMFAGCVAGSSRAWGAGGLVGYMMSWRRLVKALGEVSAPCVTSFKDCGTAYRRRCCLSPRSTIPHLLPLMNSSWT